MPRRQPMSCHSRKMCRLYECGGNLNRKLVRSRAGYVIMLNGCPVVWKSKLIDSTCLSAMMAEHCALSMSLREVLPLRDLVECMSTWSGLGSSVTTNFKVLCWEDNEGAWTLANLDPGQHTPRSKFYDSKVHWFRSYLNGPSLESCCLAIVHIVQPSTDKMPPNHPANPL